MATIGVAEVIPPFKEGDWATFRVNEIDDWVHPRSFENPSQLAEWAGQELQFWNETFTLAESLAQKHNVPNFRATSTERSHYETLRKLATDAGIDPTKRQAARDYLKEIERLVSAKKLLNSDSRITKRIMELKDSDPVAFLFALVIGSVSGNSIRIHNINNHELSLDAILTAHRLRFPTPGDQAFAITDDLKKKVDEISITLEKSRETKRNLDTLENALRAKISTEMPGNFWRDRERAHGEAVTETLRWFILIGVAFTTLYLLALNTAGKTVADAFSDPKMFAAFFALPTILGLWLLKHVSRLFAQNVARQQDAQERITILQTYLALLATKETAPSQDERRIIFETLCRAGPGAQSDGLPQESLIEGISKALKRP